MEGQGSPEMTGLWPSLSDLFVAAHAVERVGVVAVQITAFGEDGEAAQDVDQLVAALEGYERNECLSMRRSTPAGSISGPRVSLRRSGSAHVEDAEAEGDANAGDDPEAHDDGGLGPAC
jgi:hypothetical protein